MDLASCCAEECWETQMKDKVPQKHGRLYGARTYLIGAMDRVVDRGAGWRSDLIPFLVNRGIIALDPCDKPINIGLEGIEDRKRRNELKSKKDYDQLSKEIKLLRVVDLRMTDMADFIICNIDTKVHATGTYEELFWSNRLKKPVLIHCEQGKKDLPDWLFGVLPHTMFFDTWDELKEYIVGIDDGSDNRHYKRWMFFNYERMTPEGQRKYYKKKGII